MAGDPSSRSSGSSPADKQLPIAYPKQGGGSRPARVGAAANTAAAEAFYRSDSGEHSGGSSGGGRFQDDDDDDGFGWEGGGITTETLALLDEEIQTERQRGGGGAGFGDKRHATPWFAYPLLAAAVLAVSSAGPVFASMSEVPAVTVAAWRLSLTTLMLAPGAAGQYLQLPRELRRRCAEKAWVLAASGFCLALHFGAWVWGIQHTSLAHSLLLVSATPLIIAAGTWALRLPISAGELGGAAAGLAGAAFLSLQETAGGAMAGSGAAGGGGSGGGGGGGGGDVSLEGDLASLAGCVAVIGYLYAGRWLRSWMPIFVYAFAVTGIASLLLCLASIVLEDGTAAGPRGLLGWVSGGYALRVLYLAAGPGIVGHTGFNWLLRYLSPLVISLAVALEPAVGSAIGWALLGLPAPGAWTYAGGCLMLGGTMATTVAAHRREVARQSRRHAAVALTQAFGRGTGSADA